MTLPDERYRAVLQAREFLMRLAQGEYKRVPLEVRQQAWSVLKHYPGSWDMTRAAKACPDVFQGQINPVVRLVLEHREEEKR